MQFSSTFINFHLLTSTFTHFHPFSALSSINTHYDQLLSLLSTSTQWQLPLSSNPICFHHFQPLSNSFINIHPFSPLSSILIHLYQFNQFSSTFHRHGGRTVDILTCQSHIRKVSEISVSQSLQRLNEALKTSNTIIPGNQVQWEHLLWPQRAILLHHCCQVQGRNIPGCARPEQVCIHVCVCVCVCICICDLHCIFD